MRRVSRPLLATAVLPLVMLVGFQSAWAAYACRIDGEIRNHCCCSKRKHVPDSSPHITAQSCCTVAVHALPDTPLAREASRVAFDTAPVAAVTIALPVVAPHHERIASPETLARPPPLIPLYLAHHAFLC